MANVINILILLVLFGWIIKSCAEENMMTVKEINGYKVLKLEDGHWYFQSGRWSLDHYIECPKCNIKNK